MFVTQTRGWNFRAILDSMGSDGVQLTSSERPMTETNAKLAALFRSMANLLAERKENPHRVRAYRRAADSLAGLREDVADLAQRGALRQIPGIGRDLSDKILEYLTTGKVRAHEELTTPLPSELVAWINFPGLSEDIVRYLYARLGIRTLDDLDTLIRTHLLRTLPGFSGSEEDLLGAIAICKRKASSRSEP